MPTVTANYSSHSTNKGKNIYKNNASKEHKWIRLEEHQKTTELVEAKKKEICRTKIKEMPILYRMQRDNHPNWRPL